MFAQQNWIQCATKTNGSCGYHAFAEVFVRILRNHPEFINPMLFEPNNPVFKPLQDFLRHTLQIQEPLSLTAMQRIFSSPDKKFNFDFIFENVAPGVLLLFLSHYRHAVKKIKPVYDRIRIATEAAEGWSSSIDDVCFDRALAEINFVNSVSSAEATDIEREYYLESLKICITGGEEVEHDIVDILSSQYNFINHFLSSNQESLSSWQADNFKNLVCGGFSFREYADQGLLMNLSHILFRPSFITRDAVGHPNLTFPCGFGHQSQLQEIDTTFQPYAVYRCHGFAHFEYAIACSEIRDFEEQPSLPAWRRALSSMFSNQPRMAPLPEPCCHSRRKSLELISVIKNRSRDSLSQNIPRPHLSFSFLDYESLLSISVLPSAFALAAAIPLYLTFKLINFVIANPLTILLAAAWGAGIAHGLEYYFNQSLRYSPQRAYYMNDRFQLERRRRYSSGLELGMRVAEINKKLTAQAINHITEAQTAKAVRFFAEQRPARERLNRINP